ncbi:MAG: hypothetical protein RLO12_04920 [Fulvivirga sp.]
MSRFLALFILTLITSCNTSNSNEQTGKSRSELLKEIPYRGEIIADEVTNVITTNIQEVIDRTDSLNEPSIFYLTQQGEIEKLNGEWIDGSSAIKEADELWRTKRLTLTLVAYPSYSQDAITGETAELWIIEVNHKDVSRTCRMFFNSPTPNELTELDC